MRLYRFIAGILIALMGAVWALQGAWLLPASFMRGPEWILIGGAVAVFGLLLIWSATRGPSPGERPPTPSP